MILCFVKRIMLVLVFACCLPTLQAQQTLAVGQVTDAATGAAIEHVNVYFKNTSIGVKTDDQGFFLIRGDVEASTLVVSCVGYKPKEYRLKAGQQAGLQVELEELNTELEELFVFPGKNPANELMKRVRAAKSRNNIGLLENYRAKDNEQTLILLSKLKQGVITKTLFNQLLKASLDSSTHSISLPLYMVEKEYVTVGKTRELVAENIFNTKAGSERILEQLSANITANHNFYSNLLLIFDKEFISPLSNVGNLAYQYYLSDSVATQCGKQYRINFKTRNNKYLAFDGSMWIDSSTLALTRITATMPSNANINFVTNLQLSQVFERDSLNYWVRDSATIAASMSYSVGLDSLGRSPELFYKSSYKSVHRQYQPSSDFASSGYQTEDLNEKLSTLNQTPVYKAAQWIADVLLTGYAKFGKIDVGRIQSIARITEPEGFSLSLPFRTNEELWKNVSLGGSLGYGFRNQFLSYSVKGACKLPVGAWNIAGASYTDDYRSIDYDYTDFLLRENPLATGDEDISNTLFAFRSSARVGRRKEVALWLNSDLNADVETNVQFRANTIFSAAALPFTVDNEPISAFHQTQLTLSARFSFGQRTYNDHLQRIYANTYLPVLYATLDGGKFTVGEYTGNYAKFSTAIKHHLKFGFGSWNYVLQSGIYIGKVPYPFLEIPYGSETRGYNIYQFSCMGYMEYAADRYVQLHNEWRLNGVVFNHLPLIRKFNLRELVTFKMFYGSLNSKHNLLIDYPLQLNAPDKPYMEVGVGISNIFRILTLQSIWRLTDLHHEGISKWGVRAGISVSF